MKGDIVFLNQLINSMYEAVGKLEQAKNANKIEDYNKIKQFILELQKRIGEQL